MTVEEWWGPKALQLVVTAMLAIGIWVGSIQARLNGKADKSKVARDPVEADTVAAGFKGLSVQITSLESSFNSKFDDQNKRVNRLEDRLLNAITNGKT